MRHGKKHNHLSRTKAHRTALLRNLAIALIRHKRIKTTLAKAKALRVFIEPLVTKARQNTTHSRRVIFSYLQDKEAIQELFGPVATKVGDRPGGYVRVLHTGFRQGDSAEMALIEFVDFNEVYVAGKGKETEQKETTGKKRSRRGGKGAGKAAAADTTVVETITPDEPEAVVEAIAEESEEAIEATAEDIADETPEVSGEEEEQK